MPDIFDEVEEDLRADRARALLRRYGGLLFAALVLCVAGVGAWRAWIWYSNRQAAAVAAIYIAAEKQASAHPGPGRLAAVPGFEKVVREGGAGYRTLARMRLAALKAGAGDLPGAATLWLQVADDSDADKLLRDVATLDWATHELDTADPARVAGRLVPLARPDNPFHGLAREAQAMLALRQGQTDNARTELKRLSNDMTVPQGVRQRAGALLAQLGPAPDEKGKTGS